MPYNITKLYYYKDFMDDKGNLSLKNWNEMCDLAYSFRHYWPTLIVCFLSWFISLLTLILLYLIWKCKELKKVYLLSDLDLKFIILTAYTCYFLASLNAFLFYLYKSILFTLNLEKCSYIWDGFACYITQIYFGNTCVGIYLFLHISLFFERCFVAMGKKPQFCCDGFIGAFLCVATVIYSIWPQIRYFNNLGSILNDRVYCAKMTTGLDNVMNSSNVFYNCGIDSALALLGLLLYFYNKKQIGFYKSHPEAFNLQRSFNLRAMKISMLYIFPFSLVHSFTYWVNNATFMVYATFAYTMLFEHGSLMFELVGFSRIVGSFLMFLFLWLHARMRQRKVDTTPQQNQNEMDIHFDQFQRMIS